MKTLVLAFLCLALPLAARTPKPTPKATPAPAAAQEPAPLPESVPMAKQRTVQEDLELRDWISGIVTTAHAAEVQADKAEAEAKASRDQSTIAGVKLELADKQIAVVQTVVDQQTEQIANDAKKLARFYKLVTVLAFIAATFAAFMVFLMMKPGGIVGTLASFTSPMLYGAPVVTWIVVFGAAQVYLRCMF